jgi:hypothetical protein
MVLVKIPGADSIKARCSPFAPLQGRGNIRLHGVRKKASHDFVMQAHVVTKLSY